jgi:preprotein translocase subunit SecA
MWWPEMSARPPSPEDVLKKIREDMERSLKEGQRIAQQVQQSAQALSKLSDELKKLADELKKPPKTTTTR